MKLARRSRTGRFTKRPTATASRRVRRIVRKNPPKMTTAMRAKISRAVKAANRRRVASRPAVRTPITLARRSNTPSSVIRTKISRGVKLANSRRRGGISRSAGGGFGKGIIGSIISPTTLGIASGAVTASIGTGYLLRTFGNRLPGVSSPYGRVAYQLMIPATAAFFLRKKYRNFAEGLVVGGLVMASAELIRFVRTGGAPATGAIPTLAPVGEYYDATRVNGMGVAGELGVRSFGMYPETANEVNAMSNGAFPDDAY